MDDEEGIKKWVVSFIGLGAILGMLIGFSMGLIVQQFYDKELYFIESHHLENRTCINPDNNRLGYCRELTQEDCKTYGFSFVCDECMSNIEKNINITYGRTLA